MTDEERQRQIDFIIEQQAYLTATMGQLAEKVERLGEKVDRTADSVNALLAIAEIHDREIKETDERLNALINTVERHISEGKNGKG
jgi:ABC-type transporter Mla subunit MlaD